MSTTADNGNGTGHPPTEHDSSTTDTPPPLVCPDDTTQALAWIPAAQLQLSPFYKHVPAPDLGRLRELAVSIAREGLLQPLLVTPSADGTHYEVLSGRRRLLAASGTGVALPALVRQFSPHQKHEAFLAATVCTVLPESLDALTAAYDTTWTTMPAACVADGTEGSGEAASVQAILAHIRQLSPFLQRHVARDLVGTDATLWEGILAEARQQVHASETSTRQRLEDELAAAQQAARDAQLQQQRYTQTFEQLGRQMTEARVNYQRSEEQRYALEQRRQELASDNGQLRTQVETLRARLAAVGPVDRLADMPHVAAIAQAALDVVDAAGSPLVRYAIRLLDPRTAHDAATALSRTLLLVEERIRTCRQWLTDDLRSPMLPAQEQASGQEELV
jgi:hypothetical protein